MIYKEFPIYPKYAHVLNFPHDFFKTNKVLHHSDNEIIHPSTYNWGAHRLHHGTNGRHVIMLINFPSS